MQEGAFQPWGATVVVTGSPVQSVTLNNQFATAYRIRNVSTTNAYIAWTPPLNQNATVTSLPVAAPIPGVPATNLIGMVATSVEVFRLPANAWFQGSAGGTFEVTSGEGI